MTGQVLRPPTWLRLLCAAPVAALAGGLVAGGIDEGGWLLGACCTGAVALVGVGVRSWQLRVEVDHELTVVNWSRTLRIPWPEVKRFGHDGGVWVRRRSGRRHDVGAFPAVTGALRSVDRRHREVAAALEEIRERRRCR